MLGTPHLDERYRYQGSAGTMKTVEPVRAPDIEAGPGLLLQWFLMSSYLYYRLNRSVVPDKLYDMWAQMLYLEWDDFEHRHKHLVDKEALLAGTAFYISEYPLIVKHSAELLLRRAVLLPDI